MSKLAGLSEDQSRSNRRYVTRRSLSLPSRLGDTNAEVIVRDISLTGVLVESSAELAAGETLLLDLPERGETPVKVVWSCGNFFGCAFELSIPAAVVSAALLKSPVPAPVIAPAAPGETLHGEEAVEDEAPKDDRYPLRVRASVILGLSVLSWTALGLGAAWAF